MVFMDIIGPLFDRWQRTDVRTDILRRAGIQRHRPRLSWRTGQGQAQHQTSDRVLSLDVGRRHVGRHLQRHHRSGRFHLRLGVRHRRRLCLPLAAARCATTAGPRICVQCRWTNPASRDAQKCSRASRNRPARRLVGDSTTIAMDFILADWCRWRLMIILTWSPAACRVAREAKEASRPQVFHDFRHPADHRRAFITAGRCVLALAIAGIMILPFGHVQPGRRQPLCRPQLLRHPAREVRSGGKDQRRMFASRNSSMATSTMA